MALSEIMAIAILFHSSGYRCFKWYYNDHVAKRGKNSTGWFYGFKLHLVINEMGEILSFSLSRAVIDRLYHDIWEKLFGDRGYISKELLGLLYLRGIQLITRLKKNMKNVLNVRNA